MDHEIGIPKIPQRLTISPKVDPPVVSGKTPPDVQDPESFQHSWQLIFHLLVEGGRNLPRLVKTVLIPLLIVTVINIALASLSMFSLPGFLKPVVFFLIFITASYNSIIPRTVFWVVIFTAGRTLLRRFRSEGFAKVMHDFRQFPAYLKEARALLGRQAVRLLVVGAGLGFIAANFLSRNNRIDKIAVCFVLAITLIHTLSKGKKGLFFTAARLLYKDASALIKKTREFTENHTFVLTSGFILGLICNTVFAFIKLDYGGYILGGILFVLGTALVLTTSKEVSENQP